MKAACALLCLALAHGISASIFKHVNLWKDDLDVQQLEHIDQLQHQRNYRSHDESQRSNNHHRDQEVVNQKHYDQSTQYQRQRQQPYQQQQSQPQQYWDQQSQEHQTNQQYEYQQSQEQQTQYQPQRAQQAHSQEQRAQQAHSQEQRAQQAHSQEQRSQQAQSQQQWEHQSESQEQEAQSEQQRVPRSHPQQQTTKSQQQREQQIRSQQNRKQYSQPQSQWQHQQQPGNNQQQPGNNQQQPGNNQQQPGNNQHQYQHEYQYQPESSQQSQEQDQPSTFQHARRANQPTNYRYSESASHENSQEPQDSYLIETIYYDNQKPIDFDNLVMYKDEQMRSSGVVFDPNTQDQEIKKIFENARQAMKPIKPEDKVRFHQAYEVVKHQENEDAHLNATQLAQKHQYPVEEHTIRTEDGYVLTVFRIPPKKQTRDVQKRPVVFLMHGILGSADDWLLMGPGKSLAYLLSDAGYDVWMGNARGNKYSRQHVSKHPALSDFWQYSNDEIALQDLPAMIDYALQTTQQEKLYYIGHSQGNTAFFALTATRPEYNDKIIMMYALSPMVYMKNVRSPLFRMIAPTSQYQQPLQKLIGNGPFTPSKELIQTVGGAMLEKEIGCSKVSSLVNFVMAGVNVEGLDANLIPTMMAHLPAGTSTKVIKQYGQAVASDEFRRYDYGPQTNQKVYGSQEPPKYDMQIVQAPVTLYYSEEDWLAHPKDVMRLQNVLPNVRETYKVPQQYFSNMDFQFSTKAPEMVYQRLIASMENQQQQQQH